MHSYCLHGSQARLSDGKYNWSADAAGTFFLKEAVRQGVPLITLFVNSAVSVAIYMLVTYESEDRASMQPTTFTSNGQNCNGTLITSRIPAYAQYLTDVVSHWKSQGVAITHVSPMKYVSSGDTTISIILTNLVSPTVRSAVAAKKA